jgi:hypothetical protein
MLSDQVERVRQVAVSSPALAFIAPASSVQERELLCATSKECLDADIPREYLEMLSLANGFIVQTARLFGTREYQDDDGSLLLPDIVQRNLDIRDADDAFADVVVLCDDEFCYYGLDVREGVFARWGMIEADREESFQSFEAMVADLLRRGLDIAP